MAVKKTVDINLDEEITLLYEELADTDGLYTELKGHFDSVKKSRSPGALKFISDQTGSLLSIKSNKITIIKEIINVKKAKADFQIKEYNLNKEAEGDQGNVKEIAAALYDVLKGTKKGVSVGELLKQSKEEDNNPEQKEDTEIKLAERLEAIKKKKAEELAAAKAKADRDDYKIVVDELGTLYAVDEEYNLLDDVEIKNIRVEFYEDGEGNTLAKDQHGNDIEIVNLEADEEEI